MQSTSLDVEHARTLFDGLSQVRGSVCALISLTEVVHTDILDVFEQSASARGITLGKPAEMSDMFYISPSQRRRVLFFISEANDRSSELHQSVEMHHNYSFDRWREKKERSAEIDKASVELEAAIASWRAAYEAYHQSATSTDDGCEAKSKTETAALEALMGFQCCCPADVQRKVSVFLGSEYLTGLSEDYSSIFLPSLIIPQAN